MLRKYTKNMNQPLPVRDMGHIDESAINSLISHKYEFFGNHFVNNIYVRK